MGCTLVSGTFDREGVLETALLDAGITAFIASTVPCILRDPRRIASRPLCRVGLPVLDELVPSLELLLNAPGARANHAVQRCFLKAKVRLARSFSRISDESPGILTFFKVKGDCEFVVVRNVPQRLVQHSACTLENAQEL